MSPSRFLTLRTLVHDRARLDYATSERLDEMTAVALELVEELEWWALARAATISDPSRGGFPGDSAN